MDSPRRFALDASVLIDLHVGRLLVEFFRLPYRFLAPDVTIAELEAPDGESLIRHGLESVELSGEHVSAVNALRAENRRVSVNDLFALVLARDQGVALLTGDRRLRGLAEREQIMVHGTLWILDEMVRLNTASPQLAGAALTAMLASGSRLPGTECLRRLRMWTKARTDM